jgi:hypothetical protein
VISPRAVALNGVGFAPLAVASLGLVGLEAQPPIQAPAPRPGGQREDRQRRVRPGRFPDLPRELIPPPLPDPHRPSLPRRTRRRREAELMLLRH